MNICDGSYLRDICAECYNVTWVSWHLQFDHFVNNSFRQTTRKMLKFQISGPCEGNPMVTVASVIWFPCLDVVMFSASILQFDTSVLSVMGITYCNLYHTRSKKGWLCLYKSWNDLWYSDHKYHYFVLLKTSNTTTPTPTPSPPPHPYPHSCTPPPPPSTNLFSIKLTKLFPRKYLLIGIKFTESKLGASRCDTRSENRYSRHIIWLQS